MAYSQHVGGGDISSTAFVSVGPSLITIRFSSSEQLLNRGISFRCGGEGGRGKGEKEGEEGSGIKAYLA
jgi:hypothetical protein